MHSKLLIRITLIPFGIALLFAGLFFNAGQAQSSMQGTAVPTVDRLAEPTLPAQPSQADRGAQVYWLSCLPCHGDMGQGLTDEFRAIYPPEEKNCWESGCHGANPYESGFTIPKKIPAVIGDTTLAKFPNAMALHAYIQVAMPFWKPGSLTEEDSWMVTAFLMRENKLWNGVGELNPSNAEAMVIPRASFVTPVVTPQQAPAQEGGEATGLLILAGSFSMLFILLFIVQKIGKKTTM